MSRIVTLQSTADTKFDGWYLDIDGTKGNVILWDHLGRGGRWKLEELGDGIVTLQNTADTVFNGWYLDIDGTKGNVILWEKLGKGGRWKLKELGDGVVTLQNTADTKFEGWYLDIDGEKGNVILWEKLGRGGRWLLDDSKIPAPSSDQRVAVGRKGEMAFTVKVSRTGIVETERYAGIKKQDGSVHHYFWFALVDENEDTVWAMDDPLTLTIGAANDSWGRPSFTSKRERHNLTIPANAAQSMAKVAMYLERTEHNGGSIMDRIKKAGRVWKELKDNELVKDVIMLVTATAG